MVNLGSTYSKFAFGAYEVLQLNGCDLSLQHQSLDVDYAILQQYMGHIKKGGIVFIALAAACMFFEGNSDNSMYYMILDKEHNPKRSIKGKFEKNFPLIVHPKRGMKALMKESVKYRNIYDSKPQQTDEKQSLKIMSDMVNTWTRMFELQDLKGNTFSQYNCEVIEKNTEILSQIIVLCNTEGFIPVVIVPPFSSRMNCYFSEEFTKSVIDNNVKKAYKGEEHIFLNYQWDEEFQEAYSLFADGGFRLNEMGSKLLLRRIVKDLEMYGIDISNQGIKKEREYVKSTQK
jgi:hypothetical protein